MGLPRSALGAGGGQGGPPHLVPVTHLRLLVDVLAHTLAQHNEHRHSHLHVTLLGIEAQHVTHQSTEEVRWQARVVECVWDGDEREGGVHGRQGSCVSLAAAHVGRVGLVLQVLGARRSVHYLMA